MVQSQYATTADLQAISITPATAARFGLTSMTAALKSASSVADCYLPSQFKLPLQTSPQGWDMALTMAVCNIAAYLLYNDFGYSPQAPGDKMVEDRYVRAIAWLQQIAKKEIFPQYVDSTTGPDASNPEQGPFIISDPPVGFTARGVIPTSAFVNQWPW